MASCEELKILITQHAEGSLSGAGLERVEEHLRGCAACRAELEETRNALAALRRAKLPGPSADLARRISYAAFESAAASRKVTPIHSRRMRSLAAVASLAAALIVAVIAYTILFPGKPGRAPQSGPTTVASDEYQIEAEDVIIAALSGGSIAEHDDIYGMDTQETEYEPVAPGTAEDLEWVENRLDGMLASDEAGLYELLGSISEDEAKDILDSLEEEIEGRTPLPGGVT